MSVGASNGVGARRSRGRSAINEGLNSLWVRPDMPHDTKPLNTNGLLDPQILDDMNLRGVRGRADSNDIHERGGSLKVARKSVAPGHDVKGGPVRCGGVKRNSGSVFYVEIVAGVRVEVGGIAGIGDNIFAFGP